MEQTLPESAAEPKRKFRFDLQEIVKSPAFIPGVLLVIGFGLAYAYMLRGLIALWTGDEYYSHGFLVPFMAGYAIYKLWPRLSKNPVKPAPIFWIPLALMLLVAYAATMHDMLSVLSVSFLGAVLCGIAIVAGWKWMLGLSMPVVFLAFALPMWTQVVEEFTNPLQIISAQGASQILKAFQFEMFQNEPTIIYLNNYVLDVGVPCSGLKLLLALMAFTFFFISIANLKLWANLVMLALVLPLAVMVNSLRIAMIGMVGSMYGAEAGNQFHDYSGYIALILCFLVLSKVVRLLGWRD